MDLKELRRLSEGIKLPSKNMEDMISECQSKCQKRKILKRRINITSIYILHMFWIIFMATGDFSICSYDHCRCEIARE